ncbi:hypothetical protein [Butyricicoccus sp.]|uniref:hypothetical protein n=1 Tax=Butyricicoccus sp. TaxID=2049021 RepID=UPI003AF69012
MATKVALTAEEFRENSQRSIDLFNTEKLSTNSTHVRKKCILQFCAFLPLQSARSVWRQSLYPGDVEKVPQVAICTERVEAKEPASHGGRKRKSCNLHGACEGKVLALRLFPLNLGCNLHGMCGKYCSIPLRKIRENLCRPIAFLFILVYNPSCPADGHKNDENQDEDKGVDCYGEDARIAGLFRWSGYLDYRAVAEGKL